MVSAIPFPIKDRRHPVKPLMRRARSSSRLFCLRSTLYMTSPPPRHSPCRRDQHRDSALGDLRNKLNKIERAREEKANGDAWLRHAGIDPNPPRRRRSEADIRCLCGLNIYETQIWQCGQRGLFCAKCMPDDLWRELNADE